MAMPPSSQNYVASSMRAFVLHTRLKRYRLDLGLSQARVGRSVGWSQQKVAAIETGRNKVSKEDLVVLLELYGVPTTEKSALLLLAQEAERRGWWLDYGDVFEGAFPALEDEAQRLRNWAPQIIPGLLQTPEYARALIAGAISDEGEVERRLSARMRRQAILTRPEPPHLHAILDESVLERSFGGDGAMRSQMRRLLEEAERPTVTLQIMPKGAAPHPGLDGALTLIHFADPDYPDMGYFEGHFGSVYLENPHQVGRCNVAFEQVSQAALSPKESVAAIEAIATPR
jgi:transcriptional regulator with XRE-family HTH domain